MQAEVIPITRLSAPDLDLMWEYYPVVSRYGVNAQSLKTAVKSCKEGAACYCNAASSGYRGYIQIPHHPARLFGGLFYWEALQMVLVRRFGGSKPQSAWRHQDPYKSLQVSHQDSRIGRWVIQQPRTISTRA